MSRRESGATSASLVTVAGQIVSLLVSIVNLVVLSRLLTPAEFGLIAVIAAVFGFAEMLRDLGLSVAAIREPVLKSTEASSIFWFSSGLGLLLTLVGASLSQPLANLLGQQQIAEVGPWLALGFLINGLSTTFAILLIRDARFKAISLSLIISKVTGLCVAVAVAWNGGGVWSLVTLQLVSATTLLALRIGLARFAPSAPHRGDSLRKFMGLGSVVTVSTVADYAAARSGAFVLGAWVSDSSAGVFSRVYEIVTLPIQILFGPLTSVLVPSLATAEGLFIFRVRSITGVLYTIVSLICGVMIIGAPTLVPLVLGSQWDSGILVMQILAIGVAFSATGLSVIWALQAQGRARSLLAFVLLTRIVTVFGVCIGVIGGLNGVAAGFSLASFVAWFIILYWYRKVVQSGLRVALLDTSLPLVAAGIAIVVALVIQMRFNLSESILGQVFLLVVVVVLFAALLSTSGTYRHTLVTQVERLRAVIR